MVNCCHMYRQICDTSSRLPIFIMYMIIFVQCSLNVRDGFTNNIKKLCNIMAISVMHLYFIILTGSEMCKMLHDKRMKIQNYYHNTQPIMM